MIIKIKIKFIIKNLWIMNLRFHLNLHKNISAPLLNLNLLHLQVFPINSFEETKMTGNFSYSPNSETRNTIKYCPYKRSH